MTLQEILRSKGTTVYTISARATLAEVVQSLVKHNIGSLLVCESGNCDDRGMIGIITERDILRACAHHHAPLEQLIVGDVMSRNISTASPQDSVEDTMGLMTDKRIRHLPVVEDGKLLGIISIGDVVKMQHDALTMENHYLKSYIQG